MTSPLFLIVLVIFTFFFADSLLTPLLLLLWKKIWLLILKIQALTTKKNALQALAQSLLLATKALFRLVNKTVTVWILPLLLTRRQRYWLHHRAIDLRRGLRWRTLRAWVRWRRQPLWVKALTLVPALILTVGVFVASGVLLASLFGLSFVVPWIGGLPLATVVFFRRSLARLALFIFERLGVARAVNKVVDGMISLIWWRTPEPVQRRFDAWWARMKMRLRRRVIGPRRNMTRRLAKLRLGGRGGQSETPPSKPTSELSPRQADGSAAEPIPKRSARIERQTSAGVGDDEGDRSTRP